MPDGLYERDALLWSEEQARLLQRLAAGEAGVNAAVDWANVIAEVQDVGLSSPKACRSLLTEVLAHLLKIHAWPGSRSSRHWVTETKAFLNSAQKAFSPSMRQRISLPDLYADATYLVDGATDRSGKPRPWPEACPWTLDELLVPRTDPRLLAARLAA